MPRGKQESLTGRGAKTKGANWLGHVPGGGEAAAPAEPNAWFGPSKGACGQKDPTRMAPSQCILESRVCMWASQLFTGAGLNFWCDGKGYLWKVLWSPNSTCMRLISGHEITGPTLQQQWPHKWGFWPLWKLEITWSNFPAIDRLLSLGNAEIQECRKGTMTRGSSGWVGWRYLLQVYGSSLPCPWWC